MRRDAPAPAEQSNQTGAGASDEVLMTAYQAGDASAFDTLYERHRGPLYRYFVRQLAEVEARDCFQTLWLNLIRNRSRYQPSGAFRNYLFSMAHNVLMDHYRAVTRRQVADDADPDSMIGSVLDPAAAQEQTELREHLHALIKALPSHQREAWLLRQETELSTAEIAEITDSTHEGVKSRLRYARNRLKAGMARYAGRS